MIRFNALAMGIQFLNGFIWLLILGAWLYTFILFVKLARRGIKALDVYLEKSGRF